MHGFVHGEPRARLAEPERAGGSWCEHTQQLAAAAQVGDAKGIRKKITEMKMRLIKVALKATGRGSAFRGPARRRGG